MGDFNSRTGSEPDFMEENDEDTVLLHEISVIMKLMNVIKRRLNADVKYDTNYGKKTNRTVYI